MIECYAADGVHQEHARKDITQFAVRNAAPLAEACSARKGLFHTNYLQFIYHLRIYDVRF